ncbi:IS66 family transposase [Ruficoccus amylovorans]|uniref:IS66 family transposase n=1 Tax=Ruficoccus amylovorans TaxID=1804625 RepID=UPI003CCD1974
MFAKRIEQGRLSWPIGSDSSKLAITPAALTMLMNGSYASAGLLAWIVLSKYVQHQPLYRQEKVSATFFIGHPEAGQRSAIIYSIVVFCQRHNIEPDVLSRLPNMTNQDDISALSPAKWSPS